MSVAGFDRPGARGAAPADSEATPDELPSPRPLRRPPSPMIGREQVLHVARLARLSLSDEEVARMSGELSEVLEHVARIGELRLEGVAPTSHVVALENVLREDEPHPSLDRELALGPAPDRSAGGFRVPSPGA